MSTNGDPRVITLNQGERYTTDTYSVPLSAAEREQQRIAYVAAVDAMAVTLRATVKAVDEIGEQTNAIVTTLDEARLVVRQQAARIDALERAAVANARTACQRIRSVFAR